MERVRLGKTELFVSPIAFGTWSFGGEWGQFDTDEAEATIGRALELGITLFDTAQGYGFGKAERLLGGALSVSSRPGKGTRLSASLPKWQARPDAEPVSA